MVNSAYLAMRGALVPIACVMIIISCVQVAFSHFKRCPLVKRFIHWNLLLIAILYLIMTIDPLGVFNVIPYLLIWAFLPVGALLLALTFSLVVYGHFHAHYMTLKMTVPRFLIVTVTVINSFNGVATILGVTLALAKNKVRYSVINEVGSVLFMIATLCFDLYGFLLIYRLINDRRKGDEAVSFDKQARKKKGGLSGLINYTVMIQRLKRFHCFFSCVVLAVVAFLMSKLIGDVHNPGPLPPAQDPHVWEFNYQYLMILIGWFMFSLWAWIPYEKNMMENPSKKSSSSNPSSAHSTGHTSTTAHSGTISSMSTPHNAASKSNQTEKLSPVQVIISPNVNVPPYNLVASSSSDDFSQTQRTTDERNSINISSMDQGQLLGIENSENNKLLPDVPLSPSSPSSPSKVDTRLSFSTEEEKASFLDNEKQERPTSLVDEGTSNEEGQTVKPIFNPFT